ncbi:PP2C family protein-serine/threonine phosphatase [Streptomyces verrucosisporus]|uniref:PP2C family protein-serine/threonine phosphatase n=1 Tax=Streptomyces verrucosisporus TaxID=1695161 RepID=UPI0027DA2AC2|nr:PP2C family protein-serine/threonine phosphatase [Streptomyces verrucosisporus]
MRGHGSPGGARAAGIRRRGHVPARIGSRALAVLLVVVTLLVVVSDYLTDRGLGLVPLLIFLPAFVAGRGTARQTAAAAAWVVLVLVGLLVYDPFQTVSANLSTVAFTAALGGLSIAGAWQRDRRDEEITRLRSAAAALQRQILRPLPLLTDRLLADGAYEPVEEDSRVGGDIYEVMPSPYGTRVLIADVQGKGLPAIGTAFAVLGAFREAAGREPELTAVVEALEDAVVRHNAFEAQSGEPERFVTALVLNADGGRDVQVVDCGHIPPYLLRRERTGPTALPVPLRNTGVPLGLGSLAPDSRAVERFALPPDTMLLLCTDGVTEARDSSGSFFPLRERLAGWADASPREVAAGLLDQLAVHTGGNAADDIALLVLRRSRPPAQDREAASGSGGPGPPAAGSR